MAGDDPTIKIKIETDTSQATKGLDQAAKQTESFGSRFKSTFAGVLAANVIQNVAAKVYDFAKSSVDAYEKAEETTQKFEDALSRIPGASQKTTDALTAQAKALSLVTIYSAGQSKAALSSLASYGLTGDQLGKLLPLVQDYAAKTGQDLPSAAQSVGKALLGQGRALKGVGIDFKNQGSVAANYAQIVDGLGTHVGGLAKQMGGTSTGQMKIMENQVTALKVQLGAALVPAILEVAKALQPLITFIAKNTKVLVPLALGIIAVASAFKVLNFAIGLFSSNPSTLLILAIAVAVVLLGVAIYELVTHWTTVWNTIKAVTQAVWTWIQNTWDTILATLEAPFLAFWGWLQGAWDVVLAIIQSVWTWLQSNWYLLLGILTGPIGLAVALIIKFWPQVTAAIAAVLSWIAGAWATVYGFITAPIGSAVNWISSAISRIGGWFSGVASSIAGAMSGVFNAIISPFQKAWDWIEAHVLSPLKSGWNTIANAVNSIHFKVEIPSWVPVVGGKGFEWAPPHVPTLAVGGLMTASGLVYAHAGEVISPAPASVTGRSGPAIVINGMTIEKELDLSTFLRRAAWEIQTQGV